jgi:hypothetical protein
MSTQFIQKFPRLVDIPDNPFHAGIGQVGGSLYARMAGSLVLLGAQTAGQEWFIDPQNGSDSNNGTSWGDAFASPDPLDDLLDHGDIIYFRGVYKGNWNAPYKNDVTLIGVANTPRQATDSGVANGAGATWLSLDSAAASPLLQINKQAWKVVNIFFNNASTSKPCILLMRDAETPEADASHAVIAGCKFTGTDDGVKQSGGVSFVRLLGNTFFNFTGSGDIAISSETGAGVGTGLEWEIAYNVFHDNVHNIIVPLNCGRIHHNWFVKVGHAVTSTSIINLTSAGHVTVDHNIMGHAAVEAPNDTLYVDGTACLWIANECSDAVRYGKPDES